jgi:hypothetical protein
MYPNFFGIKLYQSAGQQFLLLFKFATWTLSHKTLGSVHERLKFPAVLAESRLAAPEREECSATGNSANSENCLAR